MFRPEMETYTVMETQKEREVCFTSNATNLIMSLEIITQDGAAIGKYNSSYCMNYSISFFFR